MADSKERTGIQAEQAKVGVSASASTATTAAPKRAPDRPEQLLRAPRFDVVLIGAGIVLAFLLVSVPISNSDVLMHLATGRAIVQGDVSFGKAPFTYTSDVYWTNHSWLFDVLSYFVYSLPGIGGAALVVLKAASVALLAFLMIRAGQAGPSRWIPLVVVMVAMVVLSPRLRYQPSFVSVVLLGVTIWFLKRADGTLYGSSVDAAKPVTLKTYWPLLLTFALWANLDEWFILGPLTVLLYLVGGLLQSLLPGSGATSERRVSFATLGAVLGLGALVCMLNPHHVHVYELPTLLSWSESTKMLERSILFTYFETPFAARPGGYLYLADISAAKVAYFVLIGLSLLGFGLNYRRFQFDRALLWLAFFGLSAYRATLIPFFAVAAGVVTARNLHEAVEAFVARVQLGRKRPIEWSLYGRSVTLLGMIVLFMVAWPGWLHSEHLYREQRIAWKVELDPSLKEAAERLNEIHEAGLLGEDGKNLIFNTSPEAANFLAWYCPSQKSFFDYRFKAFVDSQIDYYNLRTALLGDMVPSPSGFVYVEHPEARFLREEILRRRNVQCVVLHERNSKLLALEMRKFQLYPKEWKLVFIKGRVAIFANVAAEGGQPALAEREVDLEARAYWPPKEGGYRPPETGPNRLPAHKAFWVQWWERERGFPVNEDEANQFLEMFAVGRENSLARRNQAWKSALAVGVIGQANGGAALGQSFLTTKMALMDAEIDNAQRERRQLNEPDRELVRDWSILNSSFFIEHDDAPVQFLYLALHAARRAIAANPNNADAHFVLGRIYLTLRNQSGERLMAVQFPRLGRIRLLQAVVAFRQAVMLNDKLRDAHLELARLYGEMRAPPRGQSSRAFPPYLDLQEFHLSKYLELLRKRGPLDEKSRDAYEGNLRRLRENVEKLREAVDDQTNRYKSVAERILHPEGQAVVAHQNGLALEALRVLATGGSAEMGQMATLMQLRLHLELGQVRELQAVMTPALEANLGPDYALLYDEISIERDLANGNYAAADERLKLLQMPMDDDHRLDAPIFRRDALLLAQMIIREPFRGASPLNNLSFIQLERGRTAIVRVDYQDYGTVQHVRQTLRSDAHTYVARGMLAVEAGQPEKAKVLFERAIRFYEPKDKKRSRIDFRGRRLAQGFLKSIEEAEKVNGAK